MYHGKSFPDLAGEYIFGDWGRGNGHLFVAHPPLFGSGMWTMTEIQIEIPGSPSGMGQLQGIGQDENGELYVLTKAPGTGVTGDSGVVYKVVTPNHMSP